MKSKAATRIQKDVAGVPTEDVKFSYVLPTLMHGRSVPMRVCGNAFAYAYGLGKNTRTSYEKVAREDLLRHLPVIGNRQLK
jgi:hypothetical protein